jgi:roadblock/LC7 domain-containing protein
MPIGSYPARLGIEAPLEVKNWRPLVNWFLAIPHYLVIYALRILRGVLTIIAFFTILFTKKVPESIFNMIVMTRRYGWRVTTYVLWMRESYPPFSFTTSAQDDGIDPAWLSIDYPQELNRWLVLVKWWLLAIPHYIVLMFLSIGAFVVAVIAFFAVLFTGKYPEGLRSFLLGFSRWSLRVYAYAGLLRDEYPPFSLENGSPSATPAATAGAPPSQAPPPPPEGDRPPVPPPPPAG